MNGLKQWKHEMSAVIQRSGSCSFPQWKILFSWTDSGKQYLSLTNRDPEQQTKVTSGCWRSVGSDLQLISLTVFLCAASAPCCWFWTPRHQHTVWSSCRILHLRYSVTLPVTDHGGQHLFVSSFCSLQFLIFYYKLFLLSIHHTYSMCVRRFSTLCFRSWLNGFQIKCALFFTIHHIFNPDTNVTGDDLSLSNNM